MSAELDNNTDDVSFYETIELVLRDQELPFVASYASAIDAHWEARLSGNCALFDGQIVMMTARTADAESFHAECVAARFRDYLFWREVMARGNSFSRDGAHGSAIRRVRHVFGCALIFASDRGMLTVRASHGTMNDGKLHLPGGFVDVTDTIDRQSACPPAGSGAPDASQEARLVNIDGQVMREVREELGRVADHIAPQPGYIVCHCDREVGVIKRFRSDLDGTALARIAADHIAGEQAPENTAVQVVSAASDPALGDAVPYARLVIEHAFRDNSAASCAMAEERDCSVTGRAR